jgi:hypothetical protein
LGSRTVLAKVERKDGIQLVDKMAVEKVYLSAALTAAKLVLSSAASSVDLSVASSELISVEAWESRKVEQKGRATVVAKVPRLENSLADEKELNSAVLMVIRLESERVEKMALHLVVFSEQSMADWWVIG